MRLVRTPEISEGEPVYLAHFELNRDYTVHEAHVAINAIAAKNRANFDGSVKRRSNARFQAATHDLLNSGVDTVIAFVQKRAREQSPGGILTEEIKAKASTRSLEYLYRALFEYRDTSFEAIVSEMPNVMGNHAGLTRTFEAITVSQMMEGMKVELPDLVSFEKHEDAPFDFGFTGAHVAINPDPAA